MNTETTLLETMRDMFSNVKNIAVTQKREGCPIWVSGETKPIAEPLKELGFKWSRNRKAWYLSLT